MDSKTRKLIREGECRRAFKMYSERAHYTDIADALGVVPATASKYVKWYIKNRATEDEIQSIDRRSRMDMVRSEKHREMKKKADERNVWVRGIINRLIDGATIRQVAREEGRAASTIYSIISKYEEVDPEFVGEYRRVAETHKFGRFNKDGD